MQEIKLMSNRFILTHLCQKIPFFAIFSQRWARIGVSGPLGNGFPIDTELKGKNIVIIAGGFAFTTLRATLIYILANRADYGKVTVIYGARTPGCFSTEMNSRSGKNGKMWMCMSPLTRRLRAGPGWLVLCPPLQAKWGHPLKTRQTLSAGRRS